MKFLTHLRHAYKVTNLTYRCKNSLNFASVAFHGSYMTRKRGLASKISGREVNGYEGFQETFAILSLLRDDSRQVELLTENLEKHKLKNYQEDGEFKSGIAQQNQGNSLPVLTKDIKDGHSTAIEFELDKEMKNLLKSLFNPNALKHSVVSKQGSLSLPFDSTTIPLHLNTLINSSVKSDSNKLLNLKVPDLNEYLTCLAVNLCTVALQNGFSSSQKYYCTNHTHDTNSIEKIAVSGNDKIQKVDPPSNEIVKDLLKTHDDFRNGIKLLAGSSGITSEPANPIVTDSVSSRLGLLDPQLYKKSLKEADIKRKELAKRSASCKEKLSLRACQPKKPTAQVLEKINSCKSTGVKCGPEIKTVKHFESLTEPSSPFKCGFKAAESKKCSTETKDFFNQINQSGLESKCKEKIPTCDSEKAQQKNPCKAFPNITSKQDESCKPKSQKLDKKSIGQHCTGDKLAEKKTQDKSSLMSKMISDNSVKFIETTKCASKLEAKPKTSSKLSSKCNLKAKDPSKISPVTKSKLCGSSSGIEDPCKVPSITFKNIPTKSAAPSKSSPPPSKSKWLVSKEEFPSTFSKSPSASKFAASPKPKCEASNEDKPASGALKLKKSKCSPKMEHDPCRKQPEPKASKYCSKCTSNNTCLKPQMDQTDEAVSNKACKRVGMTAKKSCDSEPKNSCKSLSNTTVKPKPKCGRPPRGDTRPKCKKNSKCGSKKPSPCASKNQQSESKCGSELNKKPSKCGSKAYAPSPKTSKAEIIPKSSCSSGEVKPKIAPSLEPTKRKLHSLSNFPVANLIFSRNYSDDHPEKPKYGYKLESERSDEYRRETCENLSCKDRKSRKKGTSKPKNCYPEETLEFCPDTACYKVYAQKSVKADRKRSKPKGKSIKLTCNSLEGGSKRLNLSKEANKMETDRDKALCTKRTTGNSHDHQKRHFSSISRDNEEALIQIPHSVCTRKLNLPEINDNEALICVDSVALSDTDIHMFETGGRHSPELTLGNEASGVVTKIGKNIICNLSPGDQVVLESGIPCFKCDLCKVGRYNLCSNINFRGFLKNQCIHPASFCHKISRPISLEHAALVPQLALGCNACYEVCINPNSNVAIIGSCAKTVCAAICAISMGAENICVVCGMPETQILIEQFVTQKVGLFDSITSEKGIVETILASLGTFPDIVINCSASTKTMNAAIIALKPAGVCIVAGFLSECVAYNMMDALMKEIRIVPSFRSKNMFPKAIHLLESGRAPLDCLIANCEVCKWNELECAFKLALSEGNNGPRKAIVKCQLSG